MGNFVILITTSLHLYDEYKPMTPILDTKILQERQQRYMEGIESMITKKRDQDICIITENNGITSSCLDEFARTYKNTFIHYTSNQFLPESCNKGRKELLDIQSVLKTYNIPMTSTVIKFTGRYLLLNDTFLQTVRQHSEDYDVFYRKGSMFRSDITFDQRDESDCVLGLISLRAKFFLEDMKAEDVQEYKPIEWLYAKNIKRTIPQHRQYIMEHVGFKNDDYIV